MFRQVNETYSSLHEIVSKYGCHNVFVDLASIPTVLAISTQRNADIKFYQFVLENAAFGRRVLCTRKSTFSNYELGLQTPSLKEIDMPSLAVANLAKSNYNTLCEAFCIPGDPMPKLSLPCVDLLGRVMFDLRHLNVEYLSLPQNILACRMFDDFRVSKLGVMYFSFYLALNFYEVGVNSGLSIYDVLEDFQVHQDTVRTNHMLNLTLTYTKKNMTEIPQQKLVEYLQSVLETGGMQAVVKELITILDKVPDTAREAVSAEILRKLT